mgnify:CR=1 FL=1
MQGACDCWNRKYIFNSAMVVPAEKTAGEFPGLYFFIALLWKLFGYHEYIFRVVNTLIAFLGLFALFRTLQMIIDNLFYSLTLSLLLFTSPIFAYYANNFLTDVPALSMALIGWYFFVCVKFHHVVEVKRPEKTCFIIFV